MRDFGSNFSKKFLKTAVLRRRQFGQKSIFEASKARKINLVNIRKKFDKTFENSLEIFPLSGTNAPKFSIV